MRRSRSRMFMGIASARYLTKSSIWPTQLEGAGREQRDPPPADATKKIGLGVSGTLGMAADLRIEVLRYQETLLRARSCAERGRKMRKGFAEPRSRGSGAPEYGCSKATRRPFDKAMGIADPRS